MRTPADGVYFMTYNSKTKMDFLDPKKRRSHNIRLFIGYALVGMALLIGTGILGLYAFGFDFNRKTGEIIQNGLVFVESHPVAADIYLNGQSKGKTSNRLVIAEGQYSLELRANGYRTWKKQFGLEGGQIQQLVYPFLFPEKLVTKDVQLYASAPTLVTESPDRHWLLVAKPGSMVDLEVYDLTTTTNNPVNITLPASVITAGTGQQKLELSEWSTDNRRVVLKHTFNGSTEYILVDRETPTESQNLSKVFARPNTQFTLRDKKYDQYYVYDASTLSLSTADLKTKVITPLIDKVMTFKPHSADTVAYTTEAGASPGKVVLNVRSGADTYTLRELAKGDVQLVDIARFDNHWYVVGGTNAQGYVYIYKDPVETLKRKDGRVLAPMAALRHENPRFVSFSTNTRFLSVQTGSKFTVYDLDEIRLYRYDTALAMPETYKATWMDGHRMMAVADGKVRVFEFDGTNTQTLQGADANYPLNFDRDYKALFVMGPSMDVPGKLALTRTELRAQQ